MNLAVAAALCQLNTRFYERNAASFSDTRQCGWPGWERVAELAELANVSPESAPVRVLDLACGNLRFESYLERSFPQAPFEFVAVDNCDELVASSSVELQHAVTYTHVDVTEVLFVASQQVNKADAQAGEADEHPVEGDECSSGADARTDEPSVRRGKAAAEVRACEGELSAALAAESCDLAVAFGFLHHLPLRSWRIAVLRALIASVRSGGLVAVSLWEFMNSSQLAAKAQVTHAEALAWCADRAKDEALPIGFSSITAEAFNPGDYLLGWNNKPGQYRYCHSFARSDVDELLSAVADVATLESRFHADGRTNDLNEYLVLHVL